MEMEKLTHYLFFTVFRQCKIVSTSFEFDSLSSSVNEQLRRMLANLGENELNSSQDPDMVDVIMGLITQDEEFNNPFQVVENIKREMVRQAEVSGGKAMD